MMKQELQELVTELQDVCDSLSEQHNPNNDLNNLIRLTVCMGNLKKYTLYTQMVDEILNLIQLYENTYRYSYKECYSIKVGIVLKTKELISKINQLLEVDLFASLKRGYSEAKDTVTDAIPDEVKATYRSAVSTLHDVGRKTEKRLKSKIKNWLLSDDDGEQ